MNGKKKIVCKYNWDVFWKSICLIGGLFNLDWNLLYRVKRFKALESIFTTPHRLLKYFLIQFNLICILTFWFPRKKVSIKKFCFVECEGDRQTEKCQILFEHTYWGRLVFVKNGNPQPLFCLFFVFSNKHYNSYIK